MSGEVEDVGHFLIGCTEFRNGQKTLLEELRGWKSGHQGEGVIVVWKGGRGNWQ